MQNNVDNIRQRLMNSENNYYDKLFALTPKGLGPFTKFVNLKNTKALVVAQYLIQISRGTTEEVSE